MKRPLRTILALSFFDLLLAALGAACLLWILYARFG
jgi:hypothetical protein